MPHKIFLVDDHPLVRQGIRALIEKEPDLVVCGEAEDTPEAMGGISKACPDLAIVDLSLHSSSGIDLLESVRLRWPDLPVLVLSMYDEAVYGERALRSGAKGYVMKQEAPAKVVRAIRQVLRGRVFVSPDVSDRILQRLAGKQPEQAACTVDALSNRELQVFQLIGEGATNQKVSETLKVSVKTVESHIERMKEKLGVESGRDLIQRAVEWALSRQGPRPVF